MIDLSVLRKFAKFVFLSVFFCLPISQWLCARLLVIALILAILSGINQSTLATTLKRSWDLAFYTLVLVLGLIHTEDIRQGLKALETHSAILVLPLLFKRFAYSERSLNQICWWFSAGVLASSFINVLMAVLRYQESQNLNEFFHYSLLEPVGVQPTYMAYYVIFVVIWILYSAYYKLTNISLGLLFFFIIFLFLVLILTGGYTAFMSIILSFSFFLLKYLLDARNKRKTYISLFVTLLLGALLGLSSITEFKEIIKGHTDYWERGILWQSAINANPNPIVGVGTGDYIKTLNAYYQQHGLDYFATKNYNAHNQFIQNYFSNGLIGLVALIVLVLRPVYLAFRNQNALMILLTFPFLLYGINEVFLGRFQGVLFFGLCSLLSVTSYYSLKSQFETELSTVEMNLDKRDKE